MPPDWRPPRHAARVIDRRVAGCTPRVPAIFIIRAQGRRVEVDGAVVWRVVRRVHGVFAVRAWTWRVTPRLVAAYRCTLGKPDARLGHIAGLRTVHTVAPPATPVPVWWAVRIAGQAVRGSLRGEEARAVAKSASSVCRQESVDCVARHRRDQRAVRVHEAEAREQEDRSEHALLCRWASDRARARCARSWALGEQTLACVQSQHSLGLTCSWHSADCSGARAHRGRPAAG